jgi:hypothetical protein
MGYSVDVRTGYNGSSLGDGGARGRAVEGRALRSASARWRRIGATTPNLDSTHTQSRHPGDAQTTIG